MRFIKEFKIFEGVETMPELGTKWINEKGEKIFILKSDQYNEFIGYYKLSDPGSKTQTL